MEQNLNNSIDRLISFELSKRSFYEYCKTLYPLFYTSDRPYLYVLCDTLQQLYCGTLLNHNGTAFKKIMINIPPRFGKSLTLTNFTEWCLGIDNRNRIITVCYNETLSGRFSKKVRDSIEAKRVDEDLVVFSDIFPKTKIKYGDGSMSLWSLEGQHFNYLGGSFTGTITGMGCNIGIIDDPIKNREDAFNSMVLDKHYDFYTDTFLSRLEEGSIQIMNMTRWAKKDLCGRLLEDSPEDWYVIKMEAESNGKMLCDTLLSRESYEDKKSKISEDIFMANYHQEPMDKKGAMYGYFNTYDSLPDGLKQNYTDTADEGSDFLCSICYNEVISGGNRIAYVTDIVYSQEPMEVTESKVANMLKENKTSMAMIESNNGGRGFARNIQRLLQGVPCTVEWFHQSKNKEARIFANSHSVERLVYFPHDWKERFPLFYRHISDYQRGGKNKHDDCADALTGIVERLSSSVRTYKPQVYKAAGRF